MSDGRRTIHSGTSTSESLVERHGHEHDCPQSEPFELGAIDGAGGVRMPAPLRTIWVRSRPRTVPRIEPTPPERLHPPTTAAVMAVSSYVVPMRLSPCPLNPVKRIPPRAERVPEIA